MISFVLTDAVIDAFFALITALGLGLVLAVLTVAAFLVAKHACAAVFGRALGDADE